MDTKYVKILCVMSHDTNPKCEAILWRRMYISKTQNAQLPLQGVYHSKDVPLIDLAVFISIKQNVKVIFPEEKVWII